MVESVIFWAFALLSVGAALGAVLHRSIVYAALFLIVVFLSMAGFFILNNADFLALAQVIIYAVGLTIIMLFAIMFTGDNPVFQPGKVPRAYWVMASIVVVYVAALLLRGMLSLPVSDVPGIGRGMQMVLMREGSTGMLGQQLFTTFALPFEVASILLLVAMIGAIIIAKKRFGAEPGGGLRFPLDLDSAPRPDALEALGAQGPGQSQERRLSPQTEQSSEDVGVK